MPTTWYVTNEWIKNRTGLVGVDGDVQWMWQDFIYAVEKILNFGHIENGWCLTLFLEIKGKNVGD